jgi:FMN-binding domain
MKRAPVFVLAGAVAGFVGILSFHTRPAAPTTLPGSVGPATSASSRGWSSGSASPTAIRSVLGPTEQYGFGELAVRVTTRGNRITNVTVPVIRTAEQYSQQLAGQVIPTLRSEVLDGQTANISAVSGATYTSQAYAVSVQAALDKLHIK